MLSFLLTLTPEEQNIFFNNLSPRKRKTLVNNISLLSKLLQFKPDTPFEERVSKRFEHISRFKKGLFWDYAEHIENDGSITTFKNVLISSNGDWILMNKTNALFITKAPKIEYEGYVSLMVNRKKYTVHRVVASTFIPRPERVRKLLPRKQLVNHKDHSKDNNTVSNLEWTDFIGNLRHGFGHDDYNDYNYYLVEITMDNDFKGRQFVLDRLDTTLPFSMDKLVAIGTGPKGPYRGMKAKNIADDKIADYPLGLPNDIREAFIHTPFLFDIFSAPVIGEVQVGKYRGTKFSFYGFNEIDPFIAKFNIRHALRKNIPMCGCTFRRAGYTEALPYKGVMNEDIAADLKWHGNVSRLPIKGTILYGINKGYVFYMLSTKERSLYFTRSGIAKVANGKQRHYLGCYFEYIDINDVPNDYPVMTREVSGTLYKS